MSGIFHVRFAACVLWLAMVANGPGRDAPHPPFKVELLRPVYRNAFYATEKADRVTFRWVMLNPQRVKEGKLTYRLVGAEGKQIAEGSHPASALAISFAVPDLAVGSYLLHVTLRNAADEQVATTSVPIRRLPPAPGSEVRVDEHGSLVVNGKPRVMLGWYGNVPTSDPRPDVVALQNLETPTVVTFPSTSPIPERFKQHGIYTVANLEPGRLLYTFELWKKANHPVPSEAKRLDTPSKESRELYRKLVEKLQREAGLFGYYLADEPEINDIRPAYLANLYQLLCELDPYHPVIITNDTLAGIESHGRRACDVFNPDPYGKEHDYVPSFLRKVREVKRPGQAVMLTPWQGSHQIHFTYDIGTYPPFPYRLTRHQYLAAVALDCRGFTGYASDSFIPEPELRYGLPHLWRQIRFLEPAINAPAPVTNPEITCDKPVLSWLRVVNGQVYVIVVNDRKGTRQVCLKHASLNAIAQIYSTGDGQVVPVTSGEVKLELGEGGVVVLTSDPTGKKLLTTAAVESEIAARTREAQRPGNLLHMSRGVRARSSAGYTPWYEQGFYYAINGIRDDDGWYLSHTEPPGRLELVLPEVEPVGRVVLFTPNLQDYDLRFLTLDGSTRIAEIRGNKLEIAEHRLDPPVPTVKLQVIARATRPGSQPTRVMLREIEAYRDGGSAPVVPTRMLAEASSTARIPFDTTKQTIFWREDFSTFRTGPKFNYDGKDDFWVLDPKSLSIERPPGGGLVCRPISPAGYAGMARYLDYDRSARYLQVDVAELRGDGYRYGSVTLGDGSGKTRFRLAHSANKAGRFTIDVHALSPLFAEGSLRHALMTVSCVGPANAVLYRFREFSLTRLHEDGLSVTRADGSPLPETLRGGDEILFHVRLRKPVLDVTVDIQTGPMYSPLPLNGEASVQLARTGAKDGREWAAVVKLGKGTGSYTMAGYPILFRAVITGGTLRETYAPAFVSVSP